MSEQVRQENKMGIMPIPKLLISMSLPMMISMLVQAFYNVVDSIFVARISENALTAVSLAFPLQNLSVHQPDHRPFQKVPENYCVQLLPPADYQ